jgi:TBC1 domain family protein 5
VLWKVLLLLPPPLTTTATTTTTIKVPTTTSTATSATATSKTATPSSPPPPPPPPQPATANNPHASIITEPPPTLQHLLNALRSARSAYTSLRTHYLRVLDPSSVSSSGDGDNDDDPLNDSSEAWAALRADESLRADIALDVERCMPELAYFRDPGVQRCLGDALFVWCRLNPDVGYRQGMHEVLGMVLWVVERDALADVKGEGKKKQEDEDEDGSGGDMAAADTVVKELLDRRFVEHDVFSLFARIMQTAKSFYEPAAANLQPGPFGEEADSPMIVRAKYIFYELLPSIDAELATHLQNIDVIPQIFLMRWIRLLFGREFPFQDILDMWDLLFSSGPSLELVDYVCIAMMLRIRWDRKYQLLEEPIYGHLTFIQS